MDLIVQRHGDTVHKLEYSNHDVWLLREVVAKITDEPLKCNKQSCDSTRDDGRCDKGG